MDEIGQVPDRYLSDEQRLMRETCRRYVDEVVRPFMAASREREWLFDPDQRLPAGGRFMNDGEIVFEDGQVPEDHLLAYGGAPGQAEKYFRDAAVYLHMDATVDVSNFKIAKALFPGTAGAYAGPE